MIKELNQVSFKYSRTNRKSYTLKIRADATVLINAPKHFREKDFNIIINKHKKWILNSINKLESNKPQFLVDIESFKKLQFLGQTYDIEFVENDNSEFIYNFDTDKKIAFLTTNYKPINIINYAFKVELDAILWKMYEENKNLHTFKFKNLKLSSAKTRWGSCSNKGNVNISWRLAMAPMNIIYSVFIHELAHLVVLNHSKDFYNIVEKYDPNYKTSDAWLNLNSFILELYR